MVKKMSKESSDNNIFLKAILDQFVGVENIFTRRMFGGFGIYRSGVMFAVVADDRLYFKVDAANKSDYQDAGSIPFVYNRHDKYGTIKPVAMSYWEVPAHVIEDKDLMFRWMIKAHDAAVKAKAKAK